jgi:hypothetical protein
VKDRSIPSRCHDRARKVGLFTGRQPLRVANNV